ncbi:MAG: glycoside hydrolase family 30 protein [Acidobacteriaceae bacterium]
MRLKSTANFLLACLLMLAPSLKAQKNSEVGLWLTNPDRSALFAHQNTAVHFSKSNSASPTIEVDDHQKFQTIDGFGFALTGGSAQLLMKMDAPQREALLKQLFSTKGQGVGVSYLRVSIGSSDMNDHVYSYNDLQVGKTDVNLEDFSLNPDRADVIPVLKKILEIDPKIKILGSPWSAPAWMKTNDDVKGGSLKPEYYAIYAQYFVKYIEGMQAQGIRVDAITVQNEPLNEKNTPSMKMTSDEQDLFIKKYLGPAFEKAHITTKIILYDHNCDVPEYPLSILNDPSARKYVAGSGFHLYGGDISALTQVHDAYPSKNLYFTEQMVVDRPGATTTKIASPVKRVLIGAMRNWSRNVLLWNLAADPDFGPHTSNGGCTMCEGAITIDGNKVTRNLAYYAVAHFSKLVRPGSVRIASNEPASLPNVAFLTRSGKKVLVVANDSDAEQSFQISYHGRRMQSSLQAGAVGTYVW